MLKDKHLTVTVSPHIKTALSTEKMMWIVSCALIPASAAGIYFFGFRAALVIAACIVSSLLSELFCTLLMKKPATIKDGSAFLTGLLLALCLPPGLPLWMCFLGGFFAIAVSKFAFGGLGFNIFNPALAGRAFLMGAFAKEMTSWKTLRVFPDGITAATPLNLLKEQGYDSLMKVYDSHSYLFKELFIGHVGGSIGETSAALLIIGGLILLFARIITWHIPVSYILTVAIISYFTGGTFGIIFHLLSGGLMIGAFFMATDPVTSPLTSKGQLVFGAGCGILTMLIRLRGGYPEGVCYAILLMNSVTPLIERYSKTRIFGAGKNG
ncbi:MAG: RnfABCDGE type electron transport complex subunit D [bacterium]|nr:RnfABCDGE type electron transport complex subunit D [bacterium]